jgi:hypothetical protein
MPIVVMDFGENMPGSKKLIDILDEMNFKENEVLNKLGRLLRLIESTNPSIDDPELRWVEGQIDKFNEGSDNYGKLITKKDLIQANLYWKKYSN